MAMMRPGVAELSCDASYDGLLSFNKVLS